MSHASEEAIEFRHRQLWPEHILLGLIKNENSVAEKALSHLGITIESARKIVTELTSDLEKITNEDIIQERNELTIRDPELADLLTKSEEFLSSVTNQTLKTHYRPKESSAYFEFMKHITHGFWQKPAGRYWGTELLLRLFMTYPNERIERILGRLGLTEIEVNQAINTVRESTQEFKDMQS